MLFFTPTKRCKGVKRRHEPRRLHRCAIRRHWARRKMKDMINSCAIARVSKHSQKEPFEKQWEQFSDELRMFLGFRVRGELLSRYATSSRAFQFRIFRDDKLAIAWCGENYC